MSDVSRWAAAFIIAVLILVGLQTLKAATNFLLGRMRMAKTRSEQAQWFDGAERAHLRTRQWMFGLVWVLYLSFATSRSAYPFITLYGSLYILNRLLRNHHQATWERVSNVRGRGLWRGTLDASDSRAALFGYNSYFLIVFFDFPFADVAGLALLGYAVFVAHRNFTRADFVRLAVTSFRDSERGRLESIGLDPHGVVRHDSLPEPVRGLSRSIVAIAPSVMRCLSDEELRAVVEHERARRPHLALDHRLRLAVATGWFGVAVFASLNSTEQPGLLSWRVMSIFLPALVVTDLANRLRRRQQAHADRVAMKAVDDPLVLGQAFERIADVWFDPLVVHRAGQLSWWERIAATGHSPSIDQPQPKRVESVTGTIAAVTVAMVVAAGFVMPLAGLFGDDVARDVAFGTGRPQGSVWSGPDVTGAMHDVLQGRSPVDEDVQADYGGPRIDVDREDVVCDDNQSQVFAAGRSYAMVSENGQTIFIPCP